MHTRVEVVRQYRDEFDSATMEDLFLQFDRLHDYAAAGRLHEVTALTPTELRGWLEDLIYTARETLAELEAPTNERL